MARAKAGTIDRPLPCVILFVDHRLVCPGERTMETGITLQRLRYFVAVAELGSFRRAATALQVHQPGLCSQLDALERRLQIKLLNRTRRGTELSAIGKQLLPKARDVLASAERLAEYCANLRSGETGVVSVACYPVHLERFLATVIGEFRTKHPGVRVDLTKVRDDRRRGSGRSLFDELLAREVDLAMGPPHLHLGLTGVKAFDARIVLLLPDDHPSRHRPHVPITLLRDHAVLIAPPEYFSREKVAAAAQRAGFGLNVSAESSSPPALMALGKEGMGWPVLPDDYSLVGQRSQAYPVIVDLDGTELSTPVWLQWSQEDELSPSAQAFADCARRWSEHERRTVGAAAIRLLD
jgi:DNA-binding transcriptional LysR family regulator